MEEQHSPEKVEQIETMDDLRAAMNSPEVQAANAELSKKFLKNNRPKSLLVVVLIVGAIFMLIALTGHKASSVTPTALRTAEEVTFSWAGGKTVPLTEEQRTALLDLLGQTKVERLTGIIDETGPEGSCVVTAGEDSFTLTSTGYLLTDSNPYAITSPTPEEFWTQLTALLDI